MGYFIVVIELNTQAAKLAKYKVTQQRRLVQSEYQQKLPPTGEAKTIDTACIIHINNQQSISGIYPNSVYKMQFQVSLYITNAYKILFTSFP